ncbi:MAG TPA: peptide ABC transporter substrate-binding protein [Rhodospirillaceae bacterium]|nr:peptide ABC transporter substrate-binding protein [Rhodospirillaceae bacterium]MBB59347.1 peptide ABC transporter substrate-binding protein [Rhodospirillaceae bacterium]HAJ20440.1 peptide ABC transporter substrate-binding protein [Rhodospirillaceae bacterium]
MDGELRQKFNRIKSAFEKGQLDRRGFIVAALGVGVASSTVFGHVKQVEAATPKAGGRYRQALTGGGSGDTLNPAQILDSYMINVSSGMLRNNLTEIGSDNQLTSELAESWEATPDAAQWTFKIRKGVEFHNGKTLDATDVVDSINHHRGESDSAAKGIVSAITDIKADGDTVIFTLSGGSADFPFLMSDYHLGICPSKGDGTIDWESGVGTGGYSLDSFEPGVRTVVKKNPNYWKEGRAWFDEVESLFIADANARNTGLQTGELDSITNLDLNTVSLMRMVPTVNVFETFGNKHATLPMNCQAAPFNNNDVRLALKYSLNRQEWVDKLLQGLGEVGNDHPIGPANVYRATNEELPQRQFDPEKAKFHLKKAGMENLKVDLNIADTAFEGAVNGAQLFSETAKQSGIELNVVREPDDGYWSNVWLVKNFCGSYWGGRPTEDWMFSQVYSKGADWNESRWENERFNQLLIEARAELDSAKRREMYVEMQTLCNEDSGNIIPVFMAYTHAASTKIGMPEQLASNWELDGHKNAERWWFK